MTTVVITAATTEPVTLAEAKAWARVDGGSDDAVVTALVRAARAACERYTAGYFAQTVLATTLRADEPYTLPASAGAPTAVVGVITDLASLPAPGGVLSGYLAEYAKGIIINREPGQWSPPTYTVTYPAGYAPGLVPDDIKTAILITVAALYDDRDGSGAGLPSRARAMLDPYRVFALA